MSKGKLSTPNFGRSVEIFRNAGIKPQAFVAVIPPGAAIHRNADITEKSLGKAPGRFIPQSGEWSGLGGKTLTKGLTRDEFDRMQDWPTGNIGLMGRIYPAIDSDATNPEGRGVVSRAMRIFDGLVYAQRIRGNNDRRLYVFKAADPANDPVYTRHWTFTLNGAEHKVDIIGLGSQFLIAGTHPSGDAYEWREDASLTDPDIVQDMVSITNADIDRFEASLTDEVKYAGGEMGRMRGRRSTGHEYAAEDQDPFMSNQSIFEGLADLPNNDTNFPYRDDLVSVLTAVKAAAGRNCTDPDFVDELREWATQDPGFCDDEYFDKIWNSLDRIRAHPSALERIFAKNKLFHHVAEKFPETEKQASSAIEDAKAQRREDRDNLLADMRDKYVFRDVDLIDGNSEIVMRNRFCPNREWKAKDWYLAETTERDAQLSELWETYGSEKEGFYEFMRQLKHKYGHRCFYDRLMVHPYQSFGDIIEEHNADRNYVVRGLNKWHMSATIREARKPAVDAQAAKRDLKTILNFGNTLFGAEMWEYELDTLAYMAQEKRRPGSMLFLVGDPGVGKSLYIAMMRTMFNGTLPEQSGKVTGEKLTSEDARRFLFAGVEGCPIISILELPKGNSTNSAQMRKITALLKTMVDAGPDGDYFVIEGKGKDIRQVFNHSRIAGSSNYSDSIEIEQNDRRIFMVEVQITLSNRPDIGFYNNFEDVSQDPKRLAAFYRYLLTRDISSYSPNRPPPASSAKKQSIVARVTDATDRHVMAAAEWLRVNDRKMTDMLELTQLMSDVSIAEANFVGGGEMPIDYERIYLDDKQETGKFINVQKRILNAFTGLAPSRGVKRLPRKLLLGKTKEMRDLADEYDSYTPRQLNDILDDELDRGLPKEHPWETFRLR